MEYLDANDNEWSEMWEELSAHWLNKGDPLCINRGKCWEYLGSTEDHHTFFHPEHPISKRSEYVYLERYQVGVKWRRYA